LAAWAFATLRWNDTIRATVDPPAPYTKPPSPQTSPFLVCPPPPLGSWDKFFFQAPCICVARHTWVATISPMDIPWTPWVCGGPKCGSYNAGRGEWQPPHTTAKLPTLNLPLNVPLFCYASFQALVYFFSGFCVFCVVHHTWISPISPWISPYTHIPMDSPSYAEGRRVGHIVRGGGGWQPPIPHPPLWPDHQTGTSNPLFQANRFCETPMTY